MKFTNLPWWQPKREGRRGWWDLYAFMSLQHIPRAKVFYGISVLASLQHSLFFKKFADQIDQQFDATYANRKIVHGCMLESNFSLQMRIQHSKRELGRNCGVHWGCKKKNIYFYYCVTKIAVVMYPAADLACPRLSVGRDNRNCDLYEKIKRRSG